MIVNARPLFVIQTTKPILCPYYLYNCTCWGGVFACRFCLIWKATYPHNYTIFVSLLNVMRKHFLRSMCCVWKLWRSDFVKHLRGDLYMYLSWPTCVRQVSQTFFSSHSFFPKLQKICIFFEKQFWFEIRFNPNVNELCLKLNRINHN